MTSPQFEKPISDLRRRMLQDMSNRNFGDKTKHDYIRHIEALAKFLGRTPDTATADDVRQFQADQIAGGAQPPNMNSQASALRFFFTITLGRPELANQLARTHYPKKLPRVLAPEEVGRLLEAPPGPGLKYKAALSIAYGAGLRSGEVVMLRVSDIDSKRMLLRVEQGKGRKDRHAMLSPQLLELLRAWWLQCRSKGWLFPGRDPLATGLDAATPPRVQDGRRGRRSRHVGHAAHVASHLRDAPARDHTDVRVIQVLLGHAKLDTTARYAHVATSTLRTVTSPLDRLSPGGTPPG